MSWRRPATAAGVHRHDGAAVFTGRSALLQPDRRDARAAARRAVAWCSRGEPGAGKSPSPRWPPPGPTTTAGTWCSAPATKPATCRTRRSATAIGSACRAASVLAEHVVAHGAEIASRSRPPASPGSVRSALNDRRHRHHSSAARRSSGRPAVAAHPADAVADRVTTCSGPTATRCTCSTTRRLDIAGLTIVGTYREGHTDTGDFGGWLRAGLRSACPESGVAAASAASANDESAGVPAIESPATPLGDVGRRAWRACSTTRRTATRSSSWSCSATCRETGVVRTRTTTAAGG